MPTNEERRKFAIELEDVVDIWGLHYLRDIKERLADLTEPDTETAWTCDGCDSFDTHKWCDDCARNYMDLYSSKRRTMPTNEERQEVAARLRELSEKVLDSREYEHRAICSIVGCWGDGEYSDMELKDRLADLIEPEERVCRWRHIEGTWFMSECGKRHDCVVPDNFCSNCGAKAVWDVD